MRESNLQKGLQKWLMPIAHKMEQQKHLQAIKDGMIASIPIIIIGSLCILPIAFMNLFQSGPIYQFFASISDYFMYAEKFTNGLLSVFVAYFIAESLAKKYEIKATQIGIAAIVVHLILSGVLIEGGIGNKFLGSQGLFTAIITSILTVEVTRFMINKKVIVKLPDSVPIMVADSFSSLLPLITNITIATLVGKITISITGMVFPELVMSLLAPAISSMNTLPALLIVIFFTQLLWFFGLHGPAITSAVWAPFAINYAASNVEAYAAGGEVIYIFTFGLYYTILQVTGSGLTLGLVILMMRSKSKSLKAIGRVSIIPSLFGINEPVIFGTPIIFNPLMFIPFVFGPLLVTSLTYISMTSGIVGMPIANPPGFLPPGLGAFLMTLDWKSVVLVFINLILMTAIYYPFFKVMETHELNKEEEDAQ